MRNCLHNLLLLRSNDRQSRTWMAKSHEEAQRYASTTVVWLVQAEMSPSEVEGRSPELQRNNR